MACLTKKCGGITLVVVGAIVLILGVVIGMVVPGMVAPVIDGIIVPDATTKEGLASFSEAGESPFYDSIHIFNITNKEAWLSGSAKPRVQDLGPYSFKATTTKVNTTGSADGCTISYTKNSTYTYAPEKSGKNVSLNDTIYMLNPIILGAATFFNGMGPGVQAAVLPSVLSTLMSKVEGFDLAPLGFPIKLSADMIASQFAQLQLTRMMAGNPPFANTSGIIDTLKAMPLWTMINGLLVSKLGGPLPEGFALEPAAFFKNYPGKNITVHINGTAKTVTMPSTKEIWPDFEGFTMEEGNLFFSYFNGTQVNVPMAGPMDMPTLVVALMQGLKGNGIADALTLMAINDPANKASAGLITTVGYTAMGIKSAPCTSNASAPACAAIAQRLNVADSQSLSTIFMLTALNDYLASYVQLAMPILDMMNFGLVIKGTAKDWIYGFEPLPGVKVPGMIADGLNELNETQNTGKCDIMKVQTWNKWGGKFYVDPLIFPNACPGANETTAAKCPGLNFAGYYSGEQFPRMDKISWGSRGPREQEYQVFITQVYRNLTIFYSGQDIELSGITLNRFLIPKDILSKDKYNNGKWYDVQCDGLLEGVGMLPAPNAALQDTRNIFGGASRPHFLYADPKCTTDLVDGLTPNAENHDSFLDIEPFSGTTMHVRKALQAVLLPKKSLVGDSYTPVKNVPAVSNATVQIWGGLFNAMRYAPIPYYYDAQNSQIADHLAEKFVASLYPPVHMAYGVLIGLPVVGALMMLVGAYLIYKSRATAIQESTLNMVESHIDPEKKDRL